MARHPKWSPFLREWEERYGELYRDVIVSLAALSDDDLIALRSEIQQLGQSNCSWLMYHAARDLLWSALPSDGVSFEALRENAAAVLAEQAGAA